ncbi:MAG: hypothetical protein COB65_08760 [Thalassobium sp.]|nr:MAG: hypothetical protein COB65_08760 [Thalassobium sp.]
MHSVAKYTNYYCWHLVSITLIAMCAGLIWPAYDPTQSGLAVMWVVIAARFCLWSLLLITEKTVVPADAAMVAFCSHRGLGADGPICGLNACL